jgi:hydrogenase maturation factor
MPPHLHSKDVGATFDLTGNGPEICYYNGHTADKHIHGPVKYGIDGKPFGTNDHHRGAKALGVQTLAEHPIQGRAVLLDLAKHFGTGRTKLGYKEIKKVIDTDKIDVRKGDFVVLHTGYGDMLMKAAGNPTKEQLFGTGCTLDGRDPELLQWVTDSGIVALISDNVS